MCYHYTTTQYVLLDYRKGLEPFSLTPNGCCTSLVLTIILLTRITFVSISESLIAERILLSMYFGTFQISGSALRLFKLDYPVPMYLSQNGCLCFSSQLINPFNVFGFALARVYFTSTTSYLHLLGWSDVCLFFILVKLPFTTNSDTLTVTFWFS